MVGGTDVGGQEGGESVVLGNTIYNAGKIR